MTLQKSKNFHFCSKFCTWCGQEILWTSS